MSIIIQKNYIPQTLSDLIEKSSLGQNQKDLWKKFCASLDAGQLESLNQLLTSDTDAFEQLTTNLSAKQ